ncbi:MAG: hypothetical protein V1820_03795 [archaeon]
MVTKLDNNAVSMAGEFYAMSRLFLEGYEAALTLGRAKGVDILVYNPRNSKQFKVEVKTTKTLKNESLFDGANLHWLLNVKHETPDTGLIFCFVYTDLKVSPKTYRLFFVPARRVANYCKWEHQHWLTAYHKKPVKDSEMRVFRVKAIGDTNGYEDNFAIFE